jgi:hypothetical protein
VPSQRGPFSQTRIPGVHASHECVPHGFGHCLRSADRHERTVKRGSPSGDVPLNRLRGFFALNVNGDILHLR